MYIFLFFIFLVMSDNFEEKELSQEITNKDRFYFMISYIPFLQFWLLLNDMKKSDRLIRHLHQWIALFVVYVVGTIVFSLIGLSWIWMLLYVGGVIYLSHKAYNWEYVKIEQLDMLVEKFTNTQK